MTYLNQIKMSEDKTVSSYTILVEKEDEGGFSGSCLELPAAISQGETLEELQSNMKEAIDLVLEENLMKSKHKQILKITV